jgi:DNA-binding NarL/FixJ family response regulator
MPKGPPSRNEASNTACDRGQESNSPVRVLIVEDDYFVATDLEHAFMQAGCEVVGVAVTAEEALQIAATTSPDIAIMDIRLAGARDGVDAAQELLLRHGIRSFFATAHGDQATRERAQPAQPLGWITKPYSVQLVVKSALEALGLEPADRRRLRPSS